MTLDEAITRSKEVAETKRKDYEMAVALNIPSEGCLECAAEHEQLAEWLTELQERREADRWIPVSEKLPEEKKNPNTNDFAEVLCSTNYGDVTMDSYRDGMFVCNLGNVTHWRPLPKAPESEAKSLDYQRAVEDTEYCERHEPTYNPDDGSV